MECRFTAVNHNYPRWENVINKKRSSFVYMILTFNTWILKDIYSPLKAAAATPSKIFATLLTSLMFPLDIRRICFNSVEHIAISPQQCHISPLIWFNVYENFGTSIDSFSWNVFLVKTFSPMELWIMRL